MTSELGILGNPSGATGKGEAMNDEQWIAAAKAKFDYPNPILPVFYTAEAWQRQRAGYPNYKWQDGDLDREKTKARLVEMGLDVTGL